MKKLTFLLFLLSFGLQAKTIKVGVLAPEGTTWAKNLKKMSKEIKKATDGAVKIKIYYGGSQGDEPDILRKIRVGQLQGGIFTGKTLGEINGDVRVMELPFTFMGDDSKALKTMNKLTADFNKGFTKEKFVNLGFYGLGSVYFVSQKETKSLESLNGVKIWSWQGDKLVSTIIDTMKLVSVPLPLPDVLSSLSTGVIEAAYAPPMGIVALQWNTKVKYIIDFPLSYSVGAFLISKKTWDKIPAEHRATVKKIADDYTKKTNIAIDKDNKEALAAMKKLGIGFLNFPKDDVNRGKKLRAEVIGKLKGKLFSPTILNKMESTIK